MAAKGNKKRELGSHNSSAVLGAAAKEFIYPAIVAWSALVNE